MNARGGLAVSTSRARFDRIYTTIRERISLLDYAPGQRLSEEALAQEFGTSRTPIRRVLGRLEGEGLLQSVQSVGTLVTDVDIDTLAQTYRLRMEMAELIGRVDAVEVSPDIVAHFHELNEELDVLRRAPNPRHFARLNIRFFHAIMKLTSNEPLREVSERLYYQTTRIWIKSISKLNLPDEVEIFARELRDILAAVELADLRAVGLIRRAHISLSFRRLSSNSTKSPQDMIEGKEKNLEEHQM